MTEPAVAVPGMGTVHHLDDHRPAPDTTTAEPVSLVKDPAPAVVDGDEVEAVDRADNPLADWLTVPDAPVLPAWARSTASIKANAAALVRLSWWHTRYHALRIPKYLVKTVLLAARGFYRATVGMWPTLSAQDHTAAVKALRAQSKARPEDVELATRLQIAHAERTRTRRWRFGAAAVGVAAATLGFALADPMLQGGIATAVVTPLAYLGRGKETQFLDQGAPPLRVDMSAQQLNDALRAAGLLKSGKSGDEDGPKVSCSMGPVRDGRGWAVIFDLPGVAARPPPTSSRSGKSSLRNSEWMRSRSSCPGSAPRRAATPAASACGSRTMTPTWVP
ncbi:hypothetical protein Smic_41810 [Streptomyces microflavus]|uniref:Uncharacterized protein n=1 Tax=Streptomyces microflavus TaxID=1919 RepID=A0A7J0CV67_STRMI|nr:hypothetical protein Smic_41810 [Streptomyces microflavus]